jgi:D-aminoacyl-tRNA deacylase
VLYIEIGSTEEEWQNPKAAEAVSQAVVAVAQRYQESNPVVFGVGGPHYCPAFTRLCAETPYAVSHILPKYFIKHAIERTSTPPSYAALDWKGMKGPQRDQVIQIVSELGLETKKVRVLLHESEN